MKFNYLLSLIVLINAQAFGSAAPNNDCVSGLVPDFEVGSRSERINLMMLKIIDERAYANLQRNVSASGSYPLKGIGVPIQANLSFQQWDEQRRAYFEKNRFDLTYDESVFLLRRTYSAAAWESYKECLLLNASTPGIHIVVSDYTGTDALITFKWNPPPNRQGTAGPTDVLVEAVGFDSRRFKLGAGHSRTIPFSLSAGRPLLISTSTSDGYSATRRVEFQPQRVHLFEQTKNQATMKSLLLSSLNSGRTCVVRMGPEWTSKPGGYNGYPSRTAPVDVLFEVHYDAATETWRSHGRGLDVRPTLQVHRGPSLGLEQVNIFNKLFSLGDNGELTALGAGLGDPPQTSGRLLCPFDIDDIKQPSAPALPPNLIKLIDSITRLSKAFVNSSGIRP